MSVAAANVRDALGAESQSATGRPIVSRRIGLFTVCAHPYTRIGIA